LKVAKRKSKTHLIDTFFDFWRCFFACLASKFEKMTHMKKNKKILKHQKTQNFMLISNPLKKLKNTPTKCYMQNKFDEHE
jgi:hypothetical protein